MKAVSYIIKYQEVHLVDTFWDIIESYSVQTRLATRSFQDFSDCQFTSTKITTVVEKKIGHIGYYRKFIKGYAQITTPIGKLLRKDSKFQWNEVCQRGLDTIKDKMVTTPY
jgi:hypothetical protein